MLYEFVRTRFLSVVAVAAVLIGLAYALGLLQMPELSREVKLVGLAAFGFAGWSLFTGTMIAERLPDEPVVWFVDLDAREPHDAALWELSESDAEQLMSLEGEFDQVNPRLIFGKEFDRAELEARGTWAGTLPDRKLLAALHHVDVCRGQLEEDAKLGYAMRYVGWDVVRRATLDTVETVVRRSKTGHCRTTAMASKWPLTKCLSGTNRSMRWILRR
ncbi:MAG: hypothetical protein U5K37_01220 [Natrialbaceae archaeon]|nr:hypothetical protein [Natrialbaceae archaeon]